jgi:2-polyprenyl-3-methyl-5-hydroxy-6-metoxy-1,4-benzoquinol methylase
VRDVNGTRVLDAGCGEGKNALYLASKGASVLAVDISEYAISNALKISGASPSVRYVRADIRTLALAETYDIVLLYGLYHCLNSATEVETLSGKLKCATAPEGVHVVCAFNDRRHDLTAHPGFRPLLMSHDALSKLYSNWRVRLSSDEDLWEEHPHNSIRHVHSLTRMIVQKPTSK